MRRGEVYLADLDPTKGSGQDSVALCHQMRALDKQGLSERWGALPPDRLAQIERVVLRTLGVRA